MAIVTGGELVVRTLVEAGVTHVFGLYGGHLETVFQSIREHGLTLVDVRHEAAGGHAAEGYARATRGLGVALATAGPGATNVVTSIANASADRTPVVYITAAVQQSANETNAIQGGFDQLAMVTPITKWAGRATTVGDVPRLVAHAIRVALTQPTGPTVVEIPFDVSMTPVDDTAVAIGRSIVSQTPTLPHVDAVDRALEVLAGATRPVVMAGEGAYRDGAADEVRSFALATGIPVFCDYESHGVIAASDPRYGGTFYDMLDLAAAGQQPDAVLALGVRFGRSTLGTARKLLAPDTKIIHVDVDPREIGRLRDVDVSLVADSRETMRTLNERRSRHVWPDHAAWTQAVQALSAARAIRLDQAAGASSGSGRLHPYLPMAALMHAVDDETVFVGDGAEAHHWLIAALRREHPGQFFTHGLLGATGMGMGLSLGVQAANPDRRVVCVIGDGAVGFNFTEFDTMARNGLPIVVVVMNNRAWGATKHWQQMISGPDRSIGNDLGGARYDLAAAAFGCHGEYVTSADELIPAFERALAAGRPACVNVEIEFADMPPESLALSQYE